MFQINDDKSIYVTRGDIVTFTVGAKNKDNDESYIFQVDDVVRIKVVEKKGCDVVVLQKDFLVEEETERVTIFLSEEDTRIGEVISKPTDYWYEIELNPNTYPQTIIGYDEDGAKIFKLYPEGKDLEFAPTPDTNSLAYRVEGHMEDTDVHITSEEREKLNKNTEDIESHKNDATIHVTAAQKGDWNKMVVDFAGLSGLVSTINKSVDNHIADTIVHVKQEEKNTWNMQGTDIRTITTYIANMRTEVDANSSAIGNLTEEVEGLKENGGGGSGATEEQLQQIEENRQNIEKHIVDTSAHVTSEEKQTWNEHNMSEVSHNDIRLLITELSARLNAFADSDDTTLDQMSEIVTYIKSNKDLIDAITTSKVSVTDIIDNLTTNVSDKPLSAKQGVQLKALIDAIVVPTKTSQLKNDSGFLTEHQDLSAYAKQAEVSKLQEEIADYLPKNQGSANVGKILVVGTDGNLTLTDMPEGGVSGDVVGTIDESNNILLSGELADGTYTIKYEMADGSTTNIGSLVVGSAFDNGLFEPDNAKLNYRLKSTGVEAELNGVFYTQNYIPLTSANTYLYIKGCTIATSSLTPHSYAGIWYYDTNKTLLGKVDGFVVSTDQTNTEIVDETNKVYRLKIGVAINGTALSYASNIAYARLVVPMVAPSTSTAITSDDVANVVIKLDEEIA